MIRCTTDHQALFTNPNTGTHSRSPIIAWDQDGKPLIVGRTGLTRADQLEGFDRITDYVEPHTRTITLRREGTLP